MAHSPSTLPPSFPVAEIERRLQWPMLPVLTFGGILVGLSVVALMSQLDRPALLRGLPDDVDLSVASAMLHDRTLPQTGALRWNSALLGEGGAPGVFPALDRLRARRAAEFVERARARHSWDARVWAARAALALVAGDYRAAERDYRAALDRNPHYGEARLGLGVTLAQRARLAPSPFRPRALQLASLAQFASVPPADPDYAAALWDRATLLRVVGRTEEARRVTAAYLLLDAKSPWADALRGQMDAARE